MLFGDGIGMRMDALLALESYRHDGDVDGTANAMERSYFDSTLNARLDMLVGAGQSAGLDCGLPVLRRCLDILPNSLYLDDHLLARMRPCSRGRRDEVVVIRGGRLRSR